MKLKKINFKQQKYVVPLITLPFVLFGAYQIETLMEEDNEVIAPQTELSLSLGETQDSILSKNEAYDELFANGDNRTMLEGLDKEQDSLMMYTDNLNDKQRRYIDSLEEARKRKLEQENRLASSRSSYYEPRLRNERTNRSNDEDYQRSADIIRMLNEGANGTKQRYDNNMTSSNEQTREEDDPVKTLRKQMIMLDSLEKSRDPEIIAQRKAEEKLKKNKAKMETFLNSTLKVSKSKLNPHFNSISKEVENNFVKAVIDENIKGYLGSRIRFRLLEDVYVGKNKVPKGSIIYGQISGFSLQRVNLNIVSILNNGELLPINLSVYDVDGMQGLYVPQSAFREMMRELGENSVQGTTMDNSGQGFFTSLLSRAFQSTSQTIANLIRKNKVKIKYNSYIYLINEKDLQKNEN
ncbi:conjugative transposon protein TraM [Riemerella anatipestifer]|uniref:conjugative transposon protein TraM n=1 Tax=Riemerella anatipestifer TaxID=34085 RepID=UPI00069C83AC|nr:conjugative transposon protein TraM [Riemerella anatipestifer]MDR7693393.1 conjugative transposon protein TraM [Riemerella anatipestifer]MDY3528866.1 conjugative transposon protein TraM [Riemerella anatipestifer]MDY3538081.1 conjugative transposon protein TraM [Riemerella anatipestifer]